MESRFNVEAFHASLNAVRLSRQKTWKEVAQETGVNASTLTRLGQGSNPDVNGLTALLDWADLKAEMFIRDSKGGKETEPIAEITALLRADPKLSPESASLIEEIVVTTYNRLRRD